MLKLNDGLNILVVLRLNIRLRLLYAYIIRVILYVEVLVSILDVAIVTLFLLLLCVLHAVE